MSDVVSLVDVTSELQEADWNRLLRRIQSGKCTPFLGAGACYGALPLGADVAEELAQRYGYPFPDRDLVRVAQYAAVQSDPNAPKEDVVDILAPSLWEPMSRKSSRSVTAIRFQIE